jgi:hypothetical protein
MLQYPFLASGVVVDNDHRPGCDVSFDNTTWPGPTDPLNIQTDATGRAVYTDCNDDYAAALMTKLEAAAALASAPNIFFNVYFNPAAGAFEIESGNVFYLKFRGTGGAALAKLLGFYPQSSAYAASQVGSTQLYRLTGNRATPYVWCPRRGLYDEADIGSGYDAAQTRAYSGRVRTELQPVRFVTRQLLFALCPREFVSSSKAATGETSAATPHQYKSLEAFIDTNAGNGATFYDNRLLPPVEPEYTLASGSDRTVSNLPASWTDGALARADMVCTVGIGKGRRRHIATNVGAAVTPATVWATGTSVVGLIPASGSKVALAYRKMRGVLDRAMFGASSWAKRAESAYELYNVTVNLHVEDWSE